MIIILTWFLHLNHTSKPIKLWTKIRALGSDVGLLQAVRTNQIIIWHENHNTYNIITYLSFHEVINGCSS